MKGAANHRAALIFLCAGASRRMGRPKALLPWAGTTIVAHHWTQLLAQDYFDPWIVIQEQDEPLRSELDRLGWPLQQRVVNPAAPACDMMESVRCGVRACLTRPYGSVGIALIDQPLIKHSTFTMLEGAARSAPHQIIQPACRGRRGHPVILPRSVAENLPDSPAHSLKDYLSGYASICSSTEVPDSGILIDIDTLEQYNAYVALMDQGDT